ncbi:hypothetical protein N7462_005095 [Penicillium macrosclerotiorum]|uniref:uncharacterized protein n=1 Tax=Penicillium macrosclerotiorum TaxID=303699 RepID=UPI0025470053|nr:uncharacterized protein N7462_005095 [Penicillium macrosclerotiorum]KAJ5690703.1 hypothetical protein N7462_005095 [Penicillium macrosclerotiorum]
MSRDRVIQDSDDEEIFIEEEAPSPAGAQTEHESPKRQLHDQLDYHVTEHQANYPIEHSAATDIDHEPQLGINFDKFLQSQDMSQNETTLSQQRREERWIPSTNEGGNGSIGAMMTEIGLAQRRLLDDDASTAGPLLPSTATAYPSEISQPCSFPTTSTYGYHLEAATVIDNFAYTRPAHDAPNEPTQIIAPLQANACGYSTPATSNNIEPPGDAAVEQAIRFSTSLQPVDGVYVSQPKKGPRSKSMQSTTWSPHDTEPMSSNLSTGISRSKSDNASSSLMSPRHSPQSTHDELSLPAVAVEVSTLKKRGRPKKQFLPEDDEEDELAILQESVSEPVKFPEKRRSGRPPKEPGTVISKGDSTGSPENGSLTGNNQVNDETKKGLMVVLPVALGANSRKNTSIAEGPEAAEKAPRKKKVKRSKTASVVLDKPREPDVGDDVIWVDTEPLSVEANNTQATPTIPVVEPSEVSLPKKRGRKRKKTTEELAAEAEPKPGERQQTVEAETSISYNTIAADDPASATTDPQREDTVPIESTDQSLQPADTSSNIIASEAVPQTPQRADGKGNDPAPSKGPHKGPAKHSPISSTSKVPYRVGLSKRARIAPLLKVVRK